MKENAPVPPARSPTAAPEPRMARALEAMQLAALRNGPPVWKIQTHWLSNQGTTERVQLRSGNLHLEQSLPFFDTIELWIELKVPIWLQRMDLIPFGRIQ